jgi:nicotinate-nucleotide pyrophosphorylase (carboxylating)
LIEASGGITQDNIAEYFHESVDVISLGLLSQSVPHIDYSLKIRHAQQ